MIKLGRDYWSKLLLIGLIFGFGEENIESYRFGGESKPGDDRGAVSGIGIFRD